MYFLSKELVGHEQDIKAVTSHDDKIYSCSRDGTIREWEAIGDRAVEVQQYRSHQGFVNSITYQDGYVVSGGQDSVINLVRPGATEPEYSLLGHTSNVCALQAGPDALIVSGSWDGTARLWQGVQCLATMEGHEGSVWAVMYTEHGVLTGGADRTIRLWKDGKQIKNYPIGKDCVRALAHHPLGFVSAGNDAVIRVHTFEGEVVQELEGHESFIYSLAVSVDGTIFSVGEDRTLRVWQNGSLSQTIKHPAVSVWTVNCLSNGDIVTGSSDAVVRIFTCNSERKACKEAIKRFEDSVEAASIPAQASQIPNNLPGLEALAGPGSKDGEVKMIRTSPELVEAHQWTGGVWTKIGEVVGASSKKVEYEGKHWDFVFDVDIAEGVPPLKLPYNTDENPYLAADRFINKYELDVGFQAQIVKFIENNTGGIPLGVPKQASQDPALSPPQTSSNLTPQTELLTMTAGNAAPILKKLAEFDQMEGSTLISGFQTFDITKPSEEQLQALLNTAQIWPRERRFPVLDLLRMCIAHAPVSTDLPNALRTVIKAAEFKNDEVSDKTKETNIMLGLRFLANMFSSTLGFTLMQREAQFLNDNVDGVNYPTNRNLSLALSTYLLNTSVAAYRSSSSVDGINFVGQTLQVLRSAADSEIQFRALIALGTFMRISEDVVEAARDVFEVPQVLQVIDISREERLKTVVTELQNMLQT